MKDLINIKNVIKQHIEMDRFFTGNFTLRSPADFDFKVERESMDAKNELEKIVEEVKQCCKCGLGNSRINPVPGEGNPNADIVFVGEAPGAEEDKQGIPFVGRAGKKLDDIIKAMGLTRDDVFICNILKCRPPGNRDPKIEEVEKCFPYLKRQLKAIQPKVIIALGAHAARNLLNTTAPIGRLRGRFHDYYVNDESEPIKLMPTYHPSYLIRNYTRDARAKVWEDIKKVMQLVDLPIPEKYKN